MKKIDNYGWEIRKKSEHLFQKYLKLQNNIETDWLIIGGGLTGLSSLNHLKSKITYGKITLVDSGRLGQGASSRNSGFVVDSTLNNGATTISDLRTYRKKYSLNLAGMTELRKMINDFNVECDWDECGKYHAASNLNQIYKLKKFSNLLSVSGIKHQVFEEYELLKLLGTSYYKFAIKTDGGVLLNPKKLVRGLLQNINQNAKIFENTIIKKISFKNEPIAETNDGYKIKAKKIIVAVNSGLPELNIKKMYSLPMILTSSITRKLTDIEFQSIGKPNPWGLLSVKPTGATLRFTNDRRILIRNTSDPEFKFLKFNLEKRINIHRSSFLKRFPSLNNVTFENSWTGMISVSRNGNPIFGNIKNKIFFGGTFNGGGLGLSVLFGAAMVDKALGINSTRLKIVSEYPKANILPPMAKLAAFLRIKFDQLFGSNET